MTERVATILATRGPRLAAALLLLALISGLTFVFADRAVFSTTSPDVRWLQLQPQPLENRLGLVGRIDATVRQTLAAPFDGHVQKRHVAEGQRVERGQHLLSLDTSQLDIQLRQALSELLTARRSVQDMQDWSRSDEVSRARRAVANAELNLNETQAKLADTLRLFERGIIARMEVEAVEQQIKLQKLDVAASQAELRSAQKRGQGENRQIAEMALVNAQARHDSLLALHARRELHAPFAGIVLRPQRSEGAGSPAPIQTGQHVSQGTAVLELISLEQINAVARVEEVDLHQLREGMPVQVTGDGFDGFVLQGRVASIGAQALPSVPHGAGSTYEVVVAINPLSPHQQQRVRLGMSARVTVTTYHVESGLAIPSEAVRRDADGSTFVTHRGSADEVPRRVDVTTGRAVPQGVEVFGLAPGYVALPAPGR